MKRWITLAIAALWAMAIIGCNQAQDATTGVKDAAGDAAKGAGDAMKGAGDAVKGAGDVVTGALDWSSSDKIAATAVPQIKGALESEPMLKGIPLDVSVKDKIIHIKGKVPNNDVKRKVDELMKSWSEKVSLPGDVKISNELVVG